MDLKDLSGFIETEDRRLIERYPCDNIDKEAYARAVKLVEEVGELFSEILKSSSLQRKEKSAELNLPDEFADVLITTLLLAKRMNIDISGALNRKIEKINQRYEKSEGDLKKPLPEKAQ